MKSLTIEQAREYIGKQVICWDFPEEIHEASTIPMKLLYVCRGRLPFLCEDKDGDTELYKCVSPYTAKTEPRMSVSEHVSAYLDITENDGQMSQDLADLLIKIGEEIDALGQKDAVTSIVEDLTSLPLTREEFEELKKRVERLERNEEIILG